MGHQKQLPKGETGMRVGGQKVTRTHLPQDILSFPHQHVFSLYRTMPTSIQTYITFQPYTFFNTAPLSIDGPVAVLSLWSPFLSSLEPITTKCSCPPFQSSCHGNPRTPHCPIHRTSPFRISLNLHQHFILDYFLLRHLPSEILSYTLPLLY